MRRGKRQAGQNIRTMAMRRRVRAIQSFVAAGAVLVVPLVLLRLFENLATSLQLTTATQQPLIAPQLKLLFGLLMLVSAASLVWKGLYLWKRANHADQGAKGEEEIAKTLEGLEALGWEIEYGRQLRGLGDVDVVCTSPKGNTYTIDVKSHRGKVTTDGEQLYRYIGQNKQPFEKDFLEQAMKQALRIKQQKRQKFVTPMIAFSDATVTIPSGKLRGVYVVEKARLIPLLKSLG
ncbi:nuclease-related domain-containing protein [Leptolyngbya sp. AN02str]|uniref:nuclease-related domain-containing protein n=1 Tax=Leptolyngbya sp. AN02str TaxID=3423363 RepID=UPI003D316AF9